MKPALDSLRNARLLQLIRPATGAVAIRKTEAIQGLWGGYGEILRVWLSGAALPSVVVKHVQLPPQSQQTDLLGDQRKRRSYQIELNWYQHWSPLCDEACRVPRCYAAEASPSETLMLLEDLSAAGFGERKSRLNPKEIELGLAWLAAFHARFLGVPPKGLWPVGTYWQLGTRPAELAVMPAGPLKQAAGQIDAALNRCRWQTLVHGDAKLANMCFAADGSALAMVDFQYVGAGCGIRDVAYFLDSCLSDTEVAAQRAHWLDVYFGQLKSALTAYDKPVDLAALEAEWRSLFDLAWVDFYRFLQGWMPGYHSAYAESLVSKVIARLNAPAP